MLENVKGNKSCFRGEDGFGDAVMQQESTGQAKEVVTLARISWSKG